MKITLIAIAISAAALFGFTSTAEAGGNFGFRISTGGHGGGYYSNSSHRYSSNTCQSRYLISTCEVNRCQNRRVRYDSCGRSQAYYVTVVTYRSHYSDGTHSTYTRTFS